MDSLEGRTSISRAEVSERLARTCAIIREEAPDYAADLLARMVVIWAGPRRADQEGRPMSVDRRIAALEARVGPAETIRILVLRIPANVPEDEADAYVRADPDALDRVRPARPRNWLSSRSVLCLPVPTTCSPPSSATSSWSASSEPPRRYPCRGPPSGSTR